MEPLEVLVGSHRYLVSEFHRRVRRGVEDLLQEPDRQAAAPLGERVIRAKIVLEEPLIPDVPAVLARHGALRAQSLRGASLRGNAIAGTGRLAGPIGGEGEGGRA